jgi:hypothetical protein
MLESTRADMASADSEELEAAAAILDRARLQCACTCHNRLVQKCEYCRRDVRCDRA